MWAIVARYAALNTAADQVVKDLSEIGASTSKCSSRDELREGGQALAAGKSTAATDVLGLQDARRPARPRRRAASPDRAPDPGTVGTLPTMAYIVPKKSGSWEIRESTATPAGPRSRTLASFRELTPEVIERAGARATARLDRRALTMLAHRAGAPVAAAPADAAAAALLAELSHGDTPSPGLHRLLVAALGPADREPTDSEQAMAPWLAMTARARGANLRDLLLMADAIPTSPPRDRPRFPRIASGM